jgi:hypothetical protein
MTETETCEGRTEFYSAVGVIRDVMQNHMSEMLAHVLWGMGVRPAQRETLEPQDRAVIYSHLQRCPDRTLVVGQYASYAGHASAGSSSGGGAASTCGVAAPSHGDGAAPGVCIATPAVVTAACVSFLLQPQQSRRPGPRVVFVAGKALARRYAGVVVSLDAQRSLVFQLHGGEVPRHRGPAVAMRGFSDADVQRIRSALPTDWTLEEGDGGA